MDLSIPKHLSSHTSITRTSKRGQSGEGSPNQAQEPQILSTHVLSNGGEHAGHALITRQLTLPGAPSA